MSILIEMSPVDKMKFAFSLYTHKFDDKITLNDAMTIMDHFTEYDFLLQKDLKQIFKFLSKVKNKRNNEIMSLERVQEEVVSSSPEKVVLNYKIIKKKRRKYKSKDIKKSKLMSKLKNLSIQNEAISTSASSPVKAALKSK